MAHGRQPDAGTVWEGRGDALTDARLTTVDGRMADDMRLKLPHFRVMAHVGRQNGRRGWLRVSQTELARRWGCHRNSVNGAFSDLVAWGYLAQRTQQEAGESFCQYKVRLDGEDDVPVEARPRAPGRHPAGEGSSNGGAQPDGHPKERGPDGGAQPVGHVCTAAERTRAQRQSTRPIDTARAHRLSPTIAERTPPSVPQVSTARAVGGGVIEISDRAVSGRALDARGWHSGWDQAARHAVFDLVDTAQADVAIHLLLPLVGTLPPPRGVHGASYVRDLAGRLSAWPPEVLAVVAEALIVERFQDLPMVARIVQMARTAAVHMASASAGAKRTDTDGWHADLLRADPAEPAIALTLRLVGRLGAAVTAAWFDGIEVERDQSQVVVRLRSEFKARYCQRFEDDVLIEARALWPDVEMLRITHRGARDAA